MRMSAPCRAVWIFCLEHELEFNVVDINMAEGDHATEEFIRKSPNRSVPVWEEPDGFVLWESHAILRYLAEKHASQWYPEYFGDRVRVDEVMDWHARALNHYIKHMIFPKAFKLPSEEATREIHERIDGRLHECLDKLEVCYLSETKFLTGDNISLADLVVSTSLVNLKLCSFNFGKYPKIPEWLAGVSDCLSHWSKVHAVFDEYISSRMKRD
eukprot:964728_1